jgi:uncharacterized protein YyaL (SSP411 family)
LPEAEGVGPETLARAAHALASDFDGAHGGFGGAPKFPPSMRLELLLRWGRRSGDPSAREMVEKTLEAMAAGGMYDQIGGGFHRYSVDERWLVPHFEKMLYDNAMLARLYLLAARAYGREDFRRVARETLDYLIREMTPPGGGFFAAQDADSGGHEGTYYVWNPESVLEAVGASAAPIVARGSASRPAATSKRARTVLSVVRGSPGARARVRPERGGSRGDPLVGPAEDVRAPSPKGPARNGRQAPDGLDPRSRSPAFALGARLCAEPRYEQAARDAASRILGGCRRGGELLHRERNGRCDIPGFSTDYAFSVEALLDLYEATFDPRYFREAAALQEELDRPLHRRARRVRSLDRRS